MVSIPVGVSITEEDSKFLEDKNLSPTDLLRGAIGQCREHQKISDAEIKELQRKVGVWKELCDKQRDFITEQGLIEVFANWKPTFRPLQ